MQPDLSTVLRAQILCWPVHFIDILIYTLFLSSMENKSLSCHKLHCLDDIQYLRNTPFPDIVENFIISDVPNEVDLIDSPRLAFPLPSIKYDSSDDDEHIDG